MAGGIASAGVHILVLLDERVAAGREMIWRPWVLSEKEGSVLWGDCWWRHDEEWRRIE